MHLIRDVLDKLLVDGAHDPLGRVDGLLTELRGDDHPPRVIAIETGIPVLARRLHPRLERWARAIGRRFGVRRGRTFRIRWRRVRRIDLEIEVNVKADRSPATAWERWLGKHITRHLPGSGA
jgi:hypothetical protein